MIERHQLAINAIFGLACGCTLDGCHDSSPGRAWVEGRSGMLHCQEHGWVMLTSMATLTG